MLHKEAGLTGELVRSLGGDFARVGLFAPIGRFVVFLFFLDDNKPFLEDLVESGLDVVIDLEFVLVFFLFGLLGGGGGCAVLIVGVLVVNAVGVFVDIALFAEVALFVEKIFFAETF